jgi:acetolactate synthase-1/2/3 large subunit
MVDHFRSWGVTDVFGVPGKAVCPLLFELQNQDVNFILSRHESGAGFQAAGFALTRKTIGVAIGTSGPGGTNLLTAAGQAKAYHLPLLIITGHPPIQSTGRAQGQDSSPFGTDLVKMFEPVTLFSARVDRAELFPLYLRHAIEKACTGTKGPVHLCIPFDVYMEEIESFYYPLPTHTAPVISSEIDKVIPLLDRAKRPVLFVGKGAGIADAYEEVRTLAEHWGIPVMTTPCGKGAFPTNHPLSLGGFGLGGTEKSAEYLKSGVDLMVVVGSKLSDMTLAGYTPELYPTRLIHFDSDITFTGKSIPVPTHVVLGDAKLNLQKLLELASASRKDYGITASSLAPVSNNELKLLSSAQAIRTLRSQLPEETILFGDDGSHTFFAVRHYDIYEPGTFYFDDVFGAMGHAIGYAIGAKVGNPGRTIVCLTGDGCTMMHGVEFATAVNHRIPVIFVVLNNGRLDMVEKGMSIFTGRSVGTIYEVPLDVTKFAESMGAKAFCCHNETEVSEAVKSSLRIGGPVVIEIIVDPHEIPPIMSRALTSA